MSRPNNRNRDAGFRSRNTASPLNNSSANKLSPAASTVTLGRTDSSVGSPQLAGASAIVSAESAAASSSAQSPAVSASGSDAAAAAAAAATAAPVTSAAPKMSWANIARTATAPKPAQQQQLQQQQTPAANMPVVNASPALKATVESEASSAAATPPQSRTPAAASANATATASTASQKPSHDQQAASKTAHHTQQPKEQQQQQQQQQQPKQAPQQTQPKQTPQQSQPQQQQPVVSAPASVPAGVALANLLRQAVSSKTVSSEDASRSHSVSSFVHSHLLGQMVHVIKPNNQHFIGFLADISGSDGSLSLRYARRVTDPYSAQSAANIPSFAEIEPELVLKHGEYLTITATNVDFSIGTSPQTSTQAGARGTSVGGRGPRTGFATDTAISGAVGSAQGRELKRWDPTEHAAAATTATSASGGGAGKIQFGFYGGVSGPLEPEGDSSFMSLEEDIRRRGGNTSWDQFEENRRRFGVTSDYNEELYTTKLDRTQPGFEKREREAERLAREIMKGPVSNRHLAEERGLVTELDTMDEEERYSAVLQQTSQQSGTGGRYVPPHLRGAQQQLPVQQQQQQQQQQRPVGTRPAATQQVQQSQAVKPAQQKPQTTQPSTAPAPAPVAPAASASTSSGMDRFKISKEYQDRLDQLLFKSRYRNQFVNGQQVGQQVHPALATNLKLNTNVGKIRPGGQLSALQAWPANMLPLPQQQQQQQQQKVVESQGRPAISQTDREQIISQLRLASRMTGPAATGSTATTAAAAAQPSANAAAPTASIGDKTAVTLQALSAKFIKDERMKAKQAMASSSSGKARTSGNSKRRVFDELKEFGRNFKLNIPVPDDMRDIIKRDGDSNEPASSKETVTQQPQQLPAIAEKPTATETVPVEQIALKKISAEPTASAPVETVPQPQPQPQPQPVTKPAQPAQPAAPVSVTKEQLQQQQQQQQQQQRTLKKPPSKPASPAPPQQPTTVAETKPAPAEQPPVRTASPAKRAPTPATTVEKPSAPSPAPPQPAQVAVTPSTSAAKASPQVAPAVAAPSPKPAAVSSPPPSAAAAAPATSTAPATASKPATPPIAATAAGTTVPPVNKFNPNAIAFKPRPSAAGAVRRAENPPEHKAVFFYDRNINRALAVSFPLTVARNVSFSQYIDPQNIPHQWPNCGRNLKQQLENNDLIPEVYDYNVALQTANSSQLNHSINQLSSTGMMPGFTPATALAAHHMGGMPMDINTAAAMGLTPMYASTVAPPQGTNPAAAVVSAQQPQFQQPVMYPLHYGFVPANPNAPGFPAGMMQQQPGQQQQQHPQPVQMMMPMYGRPGAFPYPPMMTTVPSQSGNIATTVNASTPIPAPSAAVPQRAPTHPNAPAITESASAASSTAAAAAGTLPPVAAGQSPPPPQQQPAVTFPAAAHPTMPQYWPGGLMPANQFVMPPPPHAPPHSHHHGPPHHAHHLQPQMIPWMPPHAAASASVSHSTPQIPQSHLGPAVSTPAIPSAVPGQAPPQGVSMPMQMQMMPAPAGSHPHVHQQHMYAAPQFAHGGYLAMSTSNPAGQQSPPPPQQQQQ
ncbi:hypothetical protein GQ42DRAFT_152350 [Ramicandelaber brevisporus]|nr:hypothetical protein GQ42DRAFT_152350 [Ramicandelaber brevisporus]